MAKIMAEKENVGKLYGKECKNYCNKRKFW